jgi:hypothetical protein
LTIVDDYQSRQSPASWKYHMAPFHRALGIAALVNEVLGAIRWNHIRLNWILLVVLALLFADGFAQLGSPRLNLPFLHPLFLPVLQMVLSSSAFAFCVVSLGCRNTIFRPAHVAAKSDGTSQAVDQLNSGKIDLRVTGRFDRGAGNSISLIEFPCQFRVSDTGAISLETRVVEVGVFDAFRPHGGERSGEWSLLVPRETLRGNLQDGFLYFGLSARRAVRLTFPGRRMTAILSVGNVPQLLALRLMFDSLLAASAASEKVFYKTLEENLAQPSTAQSAEPKVATKNSGDSVPWENLIDFSR